MKEDIGVFEKAFNELRDEGFFKDFTEKAERLQVKTRADSNKRKVGTNSGIKRTVQYDKEKYQQPDSFVGEIDILKTDKSRSDT